MSVKMLLENYLLNLKSTIEVYIHGTLESSNDDVRKVLKEGLDETLKHQQKVYNKLVENNYYCVSNVNKNEVNKVLESINE